MALANSIALFSPLKSSAGRSSDFVLGPDTHLSNTSLHCSSVLPSSVRISMNMRDGAYGQCFPLSRNQHQQRQISCQSGAVLQGEVQATEQTSPVASLEVPVLPFRIGHGFDLHRLEPNLPLIIGGVNIPHDRGCEAHSDGDVLMHCIVDAILGALGLPDIGQLFPDNDPKWKGAASHVFMREAVRRMHDAGYVIGNLDATIILQRPKLSPHKPAIIANVCELLQAPAAVVNIKAKTHEKVDSLGENRSVACHTVVLLMRKSS
eukprot:TRINITY_DN31018_c0_g1_i1.p1 TRINITY_DN31018_c0_g1~~TRINITY_DN31018_c0_g1_i1.p1  ORF type:complete len:263 (-),score=34.37 TRINITY_DN31018_c0_g1_i1:382-1170(-)